LKVGRLCSNSFANSSSSSPLSIERKISVIYIRVSKDKIIKLCDLESKKHSLQEMLELFDTKWTHYEKLYVFELMVIEQDARRYINQAIDLEKKLSEFEKSQSKRGIVIIQASPDYNKLRSSLIRQLCEINSVANVQGKGRDDFDVTVLLAAEATKLKVTETESQAVRKLADRIQKSLNSLRMLMRKYAENIEVVDPQLKNNPELVEILNDFEQYWGAGKEHLVDLDRRKELIAFSQVIEAAVERHKEFKE